MPKKFGGGAEINEYHKYNKNVDPYKEKFPEAMQNRLAERYHEIFKIFVQNSNKIDRVNFWGLTDEFSWKNQWPVPNRTNHPLLFDRGGNAKKAFFSVAKTASNQIQRSSQNEDIRVLALILTLHYSTLPKPNIMIFCR